MNGKKNVLVEGTLLVQKLGTLLLIRPTQTLIYATQKETAIDQQQHSCETLLCQRYQTILRLLSSAATVRTWWRVRELNCFNTYPNLDINL